MHSKACRNVEQKEMAPIATTHVSRSFSQPKLLNSEEVVSKSK
jgi:hypothetical protein